MTQLILSFEQTFVVGLAIAVVYLELNNKPNRKKIVLSRAIIALADITLFLLVVYGFFAGLSAGIYLLRKSMPPEFGGVLEGFVSNDVVILGLVIPGITYFLLRLRSKRSLHVRIIPQSSSDKVILRTDILETFLEFTAFVLTPYAVIAVMAVLTLFVFGSFFLEAFQILQVLPTYLFWSVLLLYVGKVWIRANFEQPFAKRWVEVILGVFVLFLVSFSVMKGIKFYFGYVDLLDQQKTQSILASYCFAMVFILWASRRLDTIWSLKHSIAAIATFSAVAYFFQA